MGYESFLNAQAQAVNIGRQREADAREQVQRNALQQAGQAYAGGDAATARNALYGGGMFNEGLALDRAEAQRTTQAEERAQVLRERQQGALVAGAMGLARMPVEQRWQAYQTRVLPHLRSQGVGDDILGQVTPDVLDDANLDALLTSFGAESATYNTRDGIVRVGPSGRGEVVYEVTPDPMEQELLRARIEATRAQAGQREAAADAANARANKTRASGGGGRSRSLGGSRSPQSSPAPAGRPWERRW